MTALLVPAASFLATFLLLALLLRSHWFAGIKDVPNERSLHARPIPRVGGIGIVIGVVLAAILLPERLGWALILPICLLVAVSLTDDIRGMGVRWRLVAHVGAAAIFVLQGLSPPVGAVAAVAMILLIVWMTNLYNFMDGSDGLAGGMAVIGFSVYGAAAWLADGRGMSLFSFSIASAALAFLCYNFHPARVFMGDTGSIPLGFLAAAIGALGWRSGVWPAWFPFLVFSPFLVDASVTLIRRLARGDKVWQAHKEHYYQRLVQSGWGHRKTALVEYVVMCGAGISAFYGARQPMSTQVVVIAAWAVFFVGTGLFLEWRWRSALLNKTEPTIGAGQQRRRS
jgi:UDP-N-acetylmuramyl pentapeptide phosphotransferase/UDP-N-acetylglucosamine-1-phosphate transferase